MDCLDHCPVDRQAASPSKLKIRVMGNESCNPASIIAGLIYSGLISISISVVDIAIAFSAIIAAPSAPLMTFTALALAVSKTSMF